MSMFVGLTGVGNSYQNNYGNIVKNADKVVSEAGQSNEVTAEEKMKQAEGFLAQHDQLYAEQQAAVMDTITDGMAVAQEIARRMSSGAKVSQADESNLMQYNMQMYMAAKNAQMMAERKKDMSDECLIDQFVERHANDRKDWTSELNDKIVKIQDMETPANEPVAKTAADVQNTSTTFDISV